MAAEVASHNGNAPLPSRLAAAVVFLASGAVLVLEVTGLRLVGPYLGVTLLADAKADQTRPSSRRTR